MTTEDTAKLPTFPPRAQKKARQNQNQSLAEKTGFAGKTLWDLVQLLLIPLVLATVGYWLSEQQHRIDLEIAADQQREVSLNAYIDNLSDLLLNHGLRASQAGSEIRIIARVRTLGTLRNLDSARKKALVLYLSEAH